MAKPTRRRPRTVAAQLLDLGRTVPQVVAVRTARLATANVVPSARDRREFTGMVLEKQVAAWQAWQGMWFASANAWQQMAMSAIRMPVSASSALRMQQQLTRGANAVAMAGIKPFQQKAAKNAKRLSRTRGK